MHLAPLETDRDESGVSIELSQMGASAYRAYEWATNGCEADFERLGIDEMEKWFRYCNDFTASCQTYDGMAAPKIAERFYGHYSDNWDKIPIRNRLAFEAVVRHMAILTDAPELIRNDLSGQEQFWKGWTEERLRRLSAAAPSIAPPAVLPVAPPAIELPSQPAGMKPPPPQPKPGNKFYHKPKKRRNTQEESDVSVSNPAPSEEQHPLA